MDWVPWASLIAAVAAIVTAAGGWWFGRQKNEADAIASLTDSVTKLNSELEEEREARRADRERFGKELDEMKRKHEQEMAALKVRVTELERENHRLLQENHEYRLLVNGLRAKDE